MNEIDELIREIAVKHGVALGRDDPIVMLQTAIELMIKRLAEHQQESVQSLQQDMSALSLGLNAVPEQFDKDFATKIQQLNALCDTIEKKTETQQALLTESCKNALNNYIHEVHRKLSYKIDNNFIMSRSVFIMTVMTAVLLGASISMVFLWLLL